MLVLTTKGCRFFDESTDTFITVKPQRLELEHSLVSLSKWESKWHVPFLDNDKLTPEQLIDYIRCMTITKNVDPLVYQMLTKDDICSIKEYIDDPMTATWFAEDANKNKANPRYKKEVITSELLYYAMIALQIPVEFEKWHLNRLITLIRVCKIKNEPKKKMSKHELMSRNMALNEARLNEAAKRNGGGTNGQL